MQPDEIIKQFEVYVDDLTELSSTEEYALLSKVLRVIYNNRPWEFLRKAGSVVTTTTTSAPAPSDFTSFMNNYLENEYNNIPEKAVVYVGTTPYQVIPMGARTQKNYGSYAYYDKVNKTINLTNAVSIGTTLTFDYKYRPVDITSNSGIIALPEEFHRYIPQVMAIDDDIIQKSEQARSQINQNRAMYKQLIVDLAHNDLRSQNI